MSFWPPPSWLRLSERCCDRDRWGSGRTGRRELHSGSREPSSRSCARLLTSRSLSRGRKGGPRGSARDASVWTNTQERAARMFRVTTTGSASCGAFTYKWKNSTTSFDGKWSQFQVPLLDLTGLSLLYGSYNVYFLKLLFMLVAEANLLETLNKEIIQCPYILTLYPKWRVPFLTTVNTELIRKL